MNWSALDIGLLRKYDRPGPRYTSYPPAPHYKAPFAHDALFEMLDADARESGLGVYVHVPFCRTICGYCGCNTESLGARGTVDGYANTLCDEIDRVLSRNSTDAPLRQLHFGGGTPALLGETALLSVLDHVRRHVAWQEETEISIELDPRVKQPGIYAFLREAGFNRLSFGVQDIDPAVQRAIGRRQPFELTRRAFEDARAASFEHLNADLVYGLPNQRKEQFIDTVDEVLSLSPSRIALFNFAYVPTVKPNQLAIGADTLPTFEEKLGIFLAAIDRLEAHGYLFLGLDHFALPDDELARAFASGRLRRNFQGYTTCDTDVLAFGASAISQLKGGFAQNVRDPKSYQDAISKGGLAIERGLALTFDDRVRRAVIEQILCSRCVDARRVEAAFGIEFESYFSGYRDALASYYDDGLIEWTDSGFDIVREGRLLLRPIAMAFDAYQRLSVGTTYSRTV